MENKEVETFKCDFRGLDSIVYKRNKTLEAEIEILNKSIEDLTSQLAMAKATPPEPLPAPPATSKTQSRLQKTGNSVRARLFKMSLHSEYHC